MSAIFGTQLYPTTPELIDRMLRGIDFSLIESVLEPQAGTGNIALQVSKRMKSSHYRNSSYEPNIDCIEIDSDLQSVLKGYGLRVVHDNYLDYYTHKHYNLIVSNPPFQDGDLHLLKSIEMQQRGGLIRCLLNAETLRNPCTRTRQDLAKKLNELGAEIEYITDAFKASERPTAVEIALVKIDIPYSDGPSVIFEEMRKAKERAVNDGEPAEQGELLHSDMILQMVEQYNFEATAIVMFINEWQKVKPHIMNRIQGEYTQPILEVKLLREYKSYELTVNGCIEALRDKYWTALFANPEFTGILTSELRDHYMRMVATLKDYEFSLFNIYTIRAQFGGLAVAGVEKAIIDLFDALSRKNSWHESLENDNIHYYSGWCANKAWKINHRIIRPNYALEKTPYDGKVRLRWSSNAMKELSDIEKVFMYLEGKPIANSRLGAIIENAVNSGQTRNIHTTYFSVTFYLKGTCHIKFHDLELLAKFNRYGSQHKKWLPPSYGKARYADMQPDEQAVVDSFEGAAAYAKVQADPKRYIVDVKQVMALTG